VKDFSTAEIKKRLVDRQWLDQRRKSPHLGTDLASDFLVFGHVRAYHDGIRAGCQRLEHRHRRAHPVEPCDVTAGENNPASAAADDHRAIGQLGLPALLDRRVKGVAIDMRDG
jgi:hypothetical protein